MVRILLGEAKSSSGTIGKIMTGTARMVMKPTMGALLGALLLSPAPANAVAITTATSFTENWDIAVSGHPDVQATAAFSNFLFLSGGTQVRFNLDVTNTTNNTGIGAYTDVRFTSFGWDTSPVATAVADTTGVFTSLTNQSLGPTHLSVCFFSGPNCNGGSNGGLESVNLAGLHGDPSTTGTFQVTLTFGQLVPPLDFSTFDGKFQTSAGSFEGFGTTGTQSVPEPGTLALLGTGLVGLALARRRKVG